VYQRRVQQGTGQNFFFFLFFSFFVKETKLFIIN
jgi:hypothetical protein